MTIIIKELIPLCEITGNVLLPFNHLINNSRISVINKLKIKTELKTLIQQAFEAGVEYERGKI